MQIRFINIIAVVFLLQVGCRSQAITSPVDFDALRQAFLSGYAELDVPRYTLSYINNLAAIPSPEEVKRQADFFQRMKASLRNVDPKKLNQAQYRDHEVMAYETELGLIRLELAAAWTADRPEVIPPGGLGTFPRGKAWYRYFLKRWVDLAVEPDSLYAFGMREVRQVKAAMLAIARRGGRDTADFHRQLTQPERYFHGAGEVREACEGLHRNLLNTLPDFFPEIENIPALNIAQNEDTDLNQVPGFYRNQTFFYTYYGRPFEKRQIGWLYTHEGLPGHHYERNYTRLFANRSPVAALFRYSAYTEGWAAYIEEIGGEFGAYPTEFDKYGKWEWDLIRSLRVPMDIGLNYYGWTDEEALHFWQEYSTGLDDIARREIARMRRWPAQVITYKYGAETFLRWQRAAAKKKDFDWVDFHTQVLQYGPLPLSLLDELIAKDKS